MSRLTMQTPSRRIAAAAVLACATTLSLAVVLPAQLASRYGETVVMATDVATPVSIVPGRIDVVFARRDAAARKQG